MSRWEHHPLVFVKLWLKSNFILLEKVFWVASIFHCSSNYYFWSILFWRDLFLVLLWWLLFHIVEFHKNKMIRLRNKHNPSEMRFKFSALENLKQQSLLYGAQNFWIHYINDLWVDCLFREDTPSWLKSIISKNWHLLASSILEVSELQLFSSSSLLICTNLLISERSLV